MSDKAVYIGMTGAQSSMHQLEILTNNLANVNTTGFRADYEIVKQTPVSKDGLQSRVYSSITGSYTDFQRGPILNTGRDLDVAISGEGFIAVQGKTGKEGYTRAGNLELVKGNLTTKSGELVMGNGGVINIPAAERVDIAADGTISVRLTGSTELITIDRIKLTKPATDQLYKDADGLFYPKSGSSVPADTQLRLIHGALEGSNVNAIDTLTKLIELSRHFEVHTNVMKTVQDDASKANQLLEIPR